MTVPFRDLGNITDSGNDKKWDYHEQMAKYQMDDYNAEKVAPDTIGADYFFLDQFMTYEMEYDFVAIEMDFLEHCRDRLDEFNKVGWDGDEEHTNSAASLKRSRYSQRTLFQNINQNGMS